MVTRILYNLGQSILKFVDEGKNFRLDSSLAQKTLQISYSCLNAFILPQFPNEKLKKFSFSLEMTAGMFDTYRIVQDIYSFFFPISAASINENQILLSMKSVNPKMFKKEKVSKEKKIKDIIKALLTEMSAKNVSYRNVNEFKNVLVQRLRKASINVDSPCKYNINKWLHSSSPLDLDRIIGVVWKVVNVGCVVDRLREWKLLDTAKLAGQIGQIPLFCWVKKPSLGQCIVGLVLTGFALQVVEACWKLTAAPQPPLTEQKHREARWSAFSSLAESILFGSIFLNMIGKMRIEAQTIDYCRIAAKFIGIYRIFSRSSHEYFQQPVIIDPKK